MKRADTGFEAGELGSGQVYSGLCQLKSFAFCAMRDGKSFERFTAGMRPDQIHMLRRSFCICMCITTLLCCTPKTGASLVAQW